MKKQDGSDAPTAKPAHPHVGVNQAGPGITVGDWQIGGTLVSSTDNRYDLPQLREAAEQREADACEAAHRGEKAPDPLGDLVKHTRSHTIPPEADPLMASIRAAIKEQKG